MAEEAKRRSGDDAEAGEKPAKGGMLTTMPVLLAIVMVVEAVVLLGAFMVLKGGPDSASGAELVAPAHGEAGAESGGGHGDGHATAGDNNRRMEIAVVDFRAPNKLSGRTFLYDVSIFVSVKSEHEAAVTQALKDREAMIRDRIRTIIAQMDPDRLNGANEPGLETLRRQVKYQLDEMIGEGLIEEVLVPRCIPFRTDF